MSGRSPQAEVPLPLAPLGNPGRVLDLQSSRVDNCPRSALPHPHSVSLPSKAPVQLDWSEDAMIFVRVCCLVFVATLLMVQSGPVTLSHRPSSSGLQSGVSQPDVATQDRIAESYGKLPLSFEANHGQTDAQVKFLSRGPGYTLFLTGDEAVFSFPGNKANRDASVISRQSRPILVTPATNAVLRMKLAKANPAAEPTGERALAGKSNYFVGSDAKKWQSNVPTYTKVKYEGVYPGIDLVYYGNLRQLEYDFIVAPGADPDRIQFDILGAKSVWRD
jgi:hypothetical protein